MKFKEIFDKEVLVEEHVRKGLKIFYEVDLDLIKPQQPEQQAVNQQPANNPTEQPPIEQPQQPQPIEQPPVEQPPVEQTPAETPETQSQELEPQQTTNGFTKSALTSVVTEDEVSENTKERIVRKFEGILELTDSQKDNIQSFEDVLGTLSEAKKNGTEILDDFSYEILTLCMNQNFQELKNKIDKKSKIYIEIYYGFKKDDSVGLRLLKRQNSEMLTSTMLIDNEIISAKFNLQKLNQQVAEYRNYNANK